MSWLKAVAPTNMNSMLVTFAVFQALMAWLKALASKNMKHMSVPPAVVPSGWDGKGHETA